MLKPSLWKALHDADGDYVIFQDSKIVAITDSDSDEDKANAHLIAAAPQMLQSLEDVVDLARAAMKEANRDGACYNIEAELEEAEAAIRKARDESGDSHKSA